MSDCGGHDHCQRDELLARVEAAEEGASQLEQDFAEALELLRETREVLIDHVCKLPLSKRDHSPVLYRIDATLSSSAAIAAISRLAAPPVPEHEG